MLGSAANLGGRIMTDEAKATHSPAPAAIARELAPRPYRKPVLVMRERLSRITAEDGKASGVTVT